MVGVVVFGVGGFGVDGAELMGASGNRRPKPGIADGCDGVAVSGAVLENRKLLLVAMLTLLVCA